MDDMTSFDRLLGRHIQGLRQQRGWSLTELAARSGVSRAMVHRIELGKVSASAALLGRLAAAFAISLSRLLAATEPATGAVQRAEGQAVWRDPVTGLTRRQVTPAGAPVELVAIELPPKARVAYPAAAYRHHRQVIWVLEGQLSFAEGAELHRLSPGDSLALGDPADCEFRNDGAAICRYVVALAQNTTPANSITFA